MKEIDQKGKCAVDGAGRGVCEGDGGGVFSAAKQDNVMCLLRYIRYDVSHRGENGHLKNSLCLTTWCQ